MLKLFKKTRISEKIIIPLFYILLISLGFAVFKDYGISVDEWELRILGFSNLKYVASFFNSDVVFELEKILKIPPLSDYLGTHGAIFALPTAFIEFYFNITESQKYYYLRHYLNYILFLLANFYFYKLVKQRFNSWFYGLVGALLYIFYNERQLFNQAKTLVFL